MKLNFLHYYRPQPVIFRLGSFTFYWYGTLIVCSLILGYFLFLYLKKQYFQKTNFQFKDGLSLILGLIISGLVGARVYHLLSELPYYFQNPSQIIKIWQGGVGIAGAIITGLVFLYFFAKKRKINFLFLVDILIPCLILGQIIGRWGNWFNQELYGLPSNSFWAIPIDLSQRLIGYQQFQYFHPVFLYESFICLLILIFVLVIHHQYLKRKIMPQGIILGVYLFLYGLSRFGIEFLRIDPQPVWLHLRLAQWVGLIMIISGIGLMKINFSFISRFKKVFR